MAIGIRCRFSKVELSGDWGQVFGFSELAGWSFVLESGSAPANFEKLNT
jgi:hypothetical protein